MSERKPPSHLNRRAKDWWRKLVSEFEFQTEADWRLLEEAAGCVQRIEECRAVIKEKGLMIPTGTGSWKPNPATNIERDCRILLARLLRELRLNDAPGIDDRPPALKKRR